MSESINGIAKNITDTLTEEETASLKNAFQKARKPAIRLRAGSGDPEAALTDFDSNQHDVFMNFDYNKNPDEISPADEKSLRFIMQVIQNQATSALANAKQDLTHDSEAWISFFAKYPLLFNFQGRNSRTYHEDDFTLDGSIAESTAFVKAFLGYSCPAGIAASLIAAIQSSSGPVLKTQTTEKNLQYLALCRGYDKASTLTIYRAQLDMRINEVKAICVSTRSVALDIKYDEVTFEINNELALALYPMLSKQAADIAAKYLSAFFLQFAEQEYQNFEKYLRSL